jgi:hypothetical protein
MPSALPPHPGVALRATALGGVQARQEIVKAGAEPAVTPEEHRVAETISWNLVLLLHGELSSLEERVKFVIPVQLTGLIGLWLQIWNFDAGPARAVAGAALGVLLVSIFISLYLIRPRALPNCWDQVVNDTASAEDSTAGEIDASIIATLSLSWEKDAKRLQRGLQSAIGLGALALVTTSVAYMVDIFGS